MPRDDNAAVRAAQIVARLTVQGPPRLTAAMAAFFNGAADEPRRRGGARAPGPRQRRPPDWQRPPSTRCATRCRPASFGRSCATRSARTSSTPGVKYNVIPGEATVEIDCRVLPGTDRGGHARGGRRAHRAGAGGGLRDRAGHLRAAGRRAGRRARSTTCSRQTVRDHDPDGIPLPFMVPFATDAKHTATLGIPTYGFSPLRLDPDERFLERFHGVDERVGIDALRWGLPVLYDVVRRFCG